VPVRAAKTRMGVCMEAHRSGEATSLHQPWTSTRWPKKVSHKFFPYLCQILTDFQNFFTAAFCEKFVVKWLLNIPPHLNCVATLPCET